MTNKNTFDSCYRCGFEAEGSYVGDYDNPVFICDECQDDEDEFYLR